MHHWLNTQSIISVPVMRSEHLLVFGFGALMHPSKVPTRPLEWLPCRALDHAMEFSHNQGFATLIPVDDTPSVDRPRHQSPGCAYGVVYWLTPSEVEDLKRRERGYKLETVRVLPIRDGSSETENVEPIQALSFISSPWHRLERPVAPTRRYAELLFEGATIRGLPSAYLEWLRDECDTSSSSRLIPAGYTDTLSRRAAMLVSITSSLGLVGRPVFSRLWECRSGWRPDTTCESFFPAAIVSRDEPLTST